MKPHLDLSPPLRHPALAVLLLLAAPASVQAAMRCGTELITEGDTVLELLNACGEPTIGAPPGPVDRAEWTYNFGPDEFMMRVLIQDGKVERIEELDRGVRLAPGELED